MLGERRKGLGLCFGINNCFLVANEWQRTTYALGALGARGSPELEKYSQVLEGEVGTKAAV